MTLVKGRIFSHVGITKNTGSEDAKKHLFQTSLS
jgi:hypothetical protein